MFIKQKYYLIIIFNFLICTYSFANLDTDGYFPKPMPINGNVNFWKLIYTKISIHEGIFHDRKNPAIVYKKVYIGDKKGKALKDYLRKSKNEIGSILKKISSIPPALLSTNELKYLKKFKGYSNYEIKSAVHRIRFQRGQKERFKEGVEFSGRYINEIRSIFSQFRIPLKLAYLPHVESSFNCKAYSKAGAAGIWQFTKSTGKRYLCINQYIDERYDPIISTIAAAKLLRKNFNKLKSWPLAITAYNHGLNGILRAIKKTKSKDISVIIQKHKSKSFKFASKNFYSCFLAACEIAENKNIYFDNLNTKSSFNRELITIQKNKIFRLCSSLNISIKTFKKYNPSLKPAYYKNIDIPKEYDVYIPSSYKSSAIKAMKLISSEDEITLWGELEQHIFGYCLNDH